MTTKATITETQRLVLEHAADHALNEIVWFPDNVKGGARTKVLEALASKGWITECRGHWFLAPGAIAALERDVPPPMPAAIKTDDPHAETPDQTVASQVVIEEINYSDPIDDEIDPSNDIEPPVAAAMALKPVRTRENSKQATVVAMLQRPEGATIAQICEATGWQSHTVRGTFAGAFKKKLGLTITSEKAPFSDRVYRVASIPKDNTEEERQFAEAERQIQTGGF
jgi:hypothetical protein